MNPIEELIHTIGFWLLVLIVGVWSKSKREKRDKQQGK
jgi:hypothetical protein